VPATGIYGWSWMITRWTYTRYHHYTSQPVASRKVLVAFPLRATASDNIPTATREYNVNTPDWSEYRTNQGCCRFSYLDVVVLARDRHGQHVRRRPLQVNRHMRVPIQGDLDIRMPQ